MCVHVSSCPYAVLTAHARAGEGLTILFTVGVNGGGARSGFK